CPHGRNFMLPGRLRVCDRASTSAAGSSQRMRGPIRSPIVAQSANWRPLTDQSGGKGRSPRWGLMRAVDPSRSLGSAFCCAAQGGVKTVGEPSLDPRARKSAILVGRMHLGRTILILLLALSVAVLPTAGGAAVAVAAKSTDTLQMSSSMDDMDCCPHKKVPSEKTINHCCSSMAACPMNCFGMVGTSSLIIFPLLLGALPFYLASNPL